MTTQRIRPAFREIQALVEAGTAAGMDDAQLLGRFLERPGEPGERAFAALVERHGPMVLRVCRGVSADDHEALDAFQATFLVLVSRARTLRRHESLSSWLHGVALRVARSARSAAIRRRLHEGRRAGSTPAEVGPAPPGADLDGLGPILHEELARLPEAYRAPILLCDLDDLTHQQAAGRLGWPVGTVKSRLTRGRARLRDRLTRRGLSPTSAASMRPGLPPKSLPPALADATARMAAGFAAGTSSAGLVPASTRTLLQGVRRMMIKDSIRRVALAALAFGLLATGLALASDGPPDVARDRTQAVARLPETPPGRQISYQTSILVVPEIGWREALSTRLRPLRQSPGFTAWTADRAVAAELIKKAGKVTAAPKVTAFEQATATISDRKQIWYVKSVKTIFNEERTGVAFQPKADSLDDGLQLGMSGRTLDQGILMQVAIDDQRVTALNCVAVPITVPGKPPETRPTSITGQYQIPTISRLEWRGEWVIPHDGVLILSLGRWHESEPKDQMTPLARFIDELISIKGWLDDLNYWESPVFERLVVVDARSIVEPEKAAGDPSKPEVVPASGSSPSKPVIESRRLPVSN